MNVDEESLAVLYLAFVQALAVSVFFILILYMTNYVIQYYSMALAIS